MSVAPNGVSQPGSVSQDLFFGESPRTAALPSIPEPVYPHVFAHTSYTASCLSASKIGKRQHSMFSNLAPRLLRTQPACASNELHKQRSVIGRGDNSMITNPQENLWGAAYGIETVSTVAFAKNTGEISGSSSLQHQKETSMATNPRENSRRGRISRETSGRLAYVGDISPRIASKHRILKISPVVIRYSTKERLRWQRTRERTYGGDAFRERRLEG